MARPPSLPVYEPNEALCIDGVCHIFRGVLATCSFVGLVHTAITIWIPVTIHLPNHACFLFQLCLGVFTTKNEAIEAYDDALCREAVKQRSSVLRMPKKR